jgi:hypothetical protein
LDGLNLLREARAAGLTVTVQGDKLVIRGPRRAEPVALRLLKHKPAVMAALVRAPAQPRQAAPEPERAGWDAADWQAYFDERAAIREFDGQRPRVEAERLAWGELLVEWHKAHGAPPPSSRCAGCGKPIGGSPAMTLADAARVHDVASYECLLKYGRRWRAAAAKALTSMGLEPPGGGTS